MALVSIDGKLITVPDGENVIQAAGRAGIHIPHYCYHPGLPIDGNCRMCMVEVEGMRGLQIACNLVLRTKRDQQGNEVPAAVVRTDTPAVKQSRQGVLEFLLLNHPIDCPVCDQAGECGLQDYYMQFGKYDHRSEVPKVEKAKAVPIGPLVILDQERCILCSRCVRFTSTVTKTGELVIVGRGDECRIETFPGVDLENDYSGNVVDLCPVGALTSRDFRFKKRVWFLKSVPSICTGCARGCNVLIDQDNHHVYRYRPRYHPQVNQWWLCDRGRLSYQAINEGRLHRASIAGQGVAFAEALGAAAKLVSEAATRAQLGFLVGPRASLEDQFLARELAASLGAPIWGLDWQARGKQDEFLMLADLAPNRRGLEALGISDDEREFRSRIDDFEAVVAVDVALPPSITPRGLVMLASHGLAGGCEAAVTLPLAMHAERVATYCQAQGRIQRVTRAFEPPGDCLPACQLLALLARELDHTLPADPEAIWPHLVQVLRLPAVMWTDFPAEGVCLPARTDERPQVGAIPQEKVTGSDPASCREGQS